MEFSIIKSIDELNQIKDDLTFVITSLSYKDLEKWANDNKLNLFIRKVDVEDYPFEIISFDDLYYQFTNVGICNHYKDWDFCFKDYYKLLNYEILGNWSKVDIE